MGLFAGENDIRLMEKTKNGRDINRHYYSLQEIDKQMNRPVVMKLKELMEFRNLHPAFNLEGKIQIESEGDRLKIIRSWQTGSVTLDANLTSYEFKIYE